jgi:mono/diheme cytochrome c family protein
VILKLCRMGGIVATLGVAIALTGAMMTVGSAVVHAADDDDGYPKANPFSGNADNELEGKRLYFKWCAACHGKHADGVSRFGDYGADLRRYWRGYPEFIRIVLNGRTEKMMPPWGGVLDEDEISQIAAYLETLQLDGAKWVAD